MSRFMEDIKKSIEAAKYGDYEPSPQRYVIVSEYLLSKLDIAEKSLQIILDTDGDNRVISIHDETARALEQIRE